jgi:anti-sigma factor RsiW
VRLTDVLFRGGHLSEQTLIEAVMSGERPAHVERCDICAERAVELGRWLDQVRATANDTVDAAFPAERLVAQQQQILRKLEQLDQPARVISFPAQPKFSREIGGRRVAAGWLGVAAAAGILLGVAGGQIAQHLRPQAQVAGTSLTSATQQHETVTPPATPGTTLLDEDTDRMIPSALDSIDRLTPALVMARVSR